SWARLPITPDKDKSRRFGLRWTCSGPRPERSRAQVRRSRPLPPPDRPLAGGTSRHPSRELIVLKFSKLDTPLQASMVRSISSSARKARTRDIPSGGARRVGVSVAPMKNLRGAGTPGGVLSWLAVVALSTLVACEETKEERSEEHTSEL